MHDLHNGVITLTRSGATFEPVNPLVHPMGALARRLDTRGVNYS